MLMLPIPSSKSIWCLSEPKDSIPKMRIPSMEMLPMPALVRRAYSFRELLPRIPACFFLKDQTAGFLFDNDIKVIGIDQKNIAGLILAAALIFISRQMLSLKKGSEMDISALNGGSFVSRKRLK